jgi:N-acetylneuraminate lyase
MEQQRLSGLIAAPFTPMHANGDLHLELIPDYHALLLDNGIKGAFICGSTGEGVSLTLHEKMQVAEAWASCNRGQSDFTVMQLVGGTCLADCKELAIQAASVGINAISFLPPFYFKPANVQVLADCCAEVAAAAPDLPFYFYHIPVLTGVRFPMLELLKAVDGRIPNFRGIKYTEEDLMDYLSCLHYAEGKYDILWGRDETFLSALAIGAKGAVGSTYNYAAPLYHRLMDAYATGNLEAAAHIQKQSIDMITLLGKYGGIATGKAFMKLIGMDCGTFRLPVRNMDEASFVAFQSDANAVGFYSFCSLLGKKDEIETALMHQEE